MLLGTPHPEHNVAPPLLAASRYTVRTLLSCYSKSVKLLLILVIHNISRPFIPIMKSIAQVNLFMVEILIFVIKNPITNN